MNKVINNILDRLNGQLLRLKKAPAELLCQGFVESLTDKRIRSIDGYVKIFSEKRAFTVKKNLMLGRMRFIKKQLTEQNAILFADYVSPAIAGMLVQENLEYADQAGNMFLKDADNCILVQNCAKPQSFEAKRGQGRAWTPTGLKVIFLLLTEPAALNWSYREIGRYSGVSLGSVNYVMKDLQERKLLVKMQNRLHFNNIREIRENWVKIYVEKLFKKQPTLNYSGKLNCSLENYPVALTGETAAARLNLIDTDKICIYQWGNINELILRNHWMQDDKGNIEVRPTFWPEIRGFKNMVPFLLIYADLIAENDSRCLEVANTIFERYLTGETNDYS